MTNLQERNQAKLSYLSEIQESIEQLRQQIEALNTKFTEETKFANAQANLTKQWNEGIAPLRDLLVSACGVYQDVDVLDDMMGDLEAIVSEVRSNFEQNKTRPNKFLDEAKKIEIEVQQPVLIQTEIVDEWDDELPAPNDNETLLSYSQIKSVIKLHDLDINMVKKIAIMLDLDVPRSIKSFAEQCDNHLTRAKLEQNIELIRTKPPMLRAA